LKFWNKFYFWGYYSGNTCHLPLTLLPLDVPQKSDMYTSYTHPPFIISSKSQPQPTQNFLINISRSNKLQEGLWSQKYTNFNKLLAADYPLQRIKVWSVLCTCCTWCNALSRSWKWYKMTFSCKMRSMWNDFYFWIMTKMHLE